MAISTFVGTCDFCETKNVALVKCEELEADFDELFALYTTSNKPSRSLENGQTYRLHEHMSAYWNKLFDLQVLKSKEIKLLLNQIGQKGIFFSEEYLEKPVEFLALVSDDDPTTDFGIRWESFSKEIKEKNRFFLSEKIDTDELQSIFERLAITYPVGQEFYRARISDELLHVEELGKPPQKSATPGRANPVGIPYLYVSDTAKTTLYETRVALHEGISIGKFVLTEPISLVSLKNIADFGPFEVMDRGFSLEEFIKFRPYLQRLESELSRPVRKQDVHLDYLPTQFLCEFIKSLGFHAVEYRSAMNFGGFNLAIFDDTRLNCIEATHHIVKSLEYDWD
ncbi:hypothetical protein AY601_1774 [Pedobacter cryoconitis]|uniref:RES domain-containing protein n=1 Tax=Pedobacter cryoconitis TaxID=188932 RepID=A0A127VBE8_9SPHI|nr:hypothetical protein AY601_1774 [Pedobacter cryoconitis]